MDPLKLFVPITKIDAVKGIVYGVLAAEEADRSDEIFDYAGSRPYFEKWSGDISKATNGASVGNLRAMHGTVAAGKFTDMVFNDESKRIDVAAKVVDKNELEKCLEGVYTGFSIGGKYIKRWDDPADKKLKRYIAEPYEGSLVDLPCIPSATFEVIKEGGATEVRKFHVEPEPAKEPTSAEIAAKATDLAKAAGKPDAWAEFIDAARTDLKKVAPVVTMPPGETKPAPAPESTGAGGGDDLGAVQVWTHERLPGKSFGKKAELRAALIDLDAQEAAAAISAPVREALAGIAKVLDRKPTMLDIVLRPLNGNIPDAVADGPRKALKLGAQDWAKVHAFAKAQPEHALCKGLAAAGEIEVKDGGVVDTTNKALGALDAFFPAALAEITKQAEAAERAKKLAAEGKALKDGSFAIETAADVKKAVVDVETAKNQSLAQRHIIRRAKLLKAIDAIPADWMDSPVFKAASLYGVSNLVQLLAQVKSAEACCEVDDYWSEATDVPKELQTRFGTLLVEFGDIVAEILDLILADMKEEEAAEAVERSVMVGDLGSLALLKVGARHSKGDLNKLNAAHDLLVDLGADCGEEDDADKAVGLRKVITAQTEQFTKTIGEVATLVKDVVERVKRIEDAPLPMGMSSVNVHEKGGGIAAKGADPATREAIADVAAEMLRLGITSAQRNPVPGIDGRRF